MIGGAVLIHKEDAFMSTTETTSADWAQMAKLAGVSSDALRRDYDAAVAAADDSITVTEGAVSTEGTCTTKHADIDFFKVLTLKGKATFCQPSSSQWSLKL